MKYAELIACTVCLTNFANFYNRANIKLVFHYAQLQHSVHYLRLFFFLGESVKFCMWSSVRFLEANQLRSNRFLNFPILLKHRQWQAFIKLLKFNGITQFKIIYLVWMNVGFASNLSCTMKVTSHKIIQNGHSRT